MSLHGWKLYLILAWLAVTTLLTGLSLFATQNTVDTVQRILSSEKVCSETNQGTACRALYDRLSDNISDAQRHRLACVVFQTAGVKPNIECPGG